MEKPYIKILGVVVVVIAVTLIITSLRSMSKYKFDQTAEQLHAQVVKAEHFLDPMSAKDILYKNDEKYLFIDIRNPRAFDNFRLESAINIPMQQVLDDDFRSVFSNEKIKVLYSENSIDADQVRLLLTQYGYDKILVLQGGVSYWKENMLKDDIFSKKGEYDDEKLKFDPEKLQEES